MAKFNYYLKDSQGWNPQKKEISEIQKTDLPTPIILFVHYRGKRVKIYIQETARPSEWDFRNKQYKTTRAVSNAIGKNTRLTALKVKAEAVLIDYLNANDQAYPPAGEYAELVKIAFKLKGEAKKDLFTFFQQIINQKIDDAGDKPHRNTDIPSYQYTLEALQKYAQKRRTRVDYDTISLDFYHDFKKYLGQDLGLKKNTIGIRIRRLKSVLIRATAAGDNKNLIYTDPSFKAVSEESENIYLTETELAVLKSLELEKDLAEVRDLFIILAWTGLRESDLKQVNRQNIINNDLQVKQQKTGGRISIPLHPAVIEILQKYDYQPPIKSQQHINRKLKSIASKLASKIELSEKDYTQLKSHTGRRSFASNMTLRGVPIHEIMAVTGHKTEKDFFRYVKIAPKEASNGIRKQFQKENKLRKVQ
jgi:integrase